MVRIKVVGAGQAAEKFTHEELHAAFHLVCDKKHWKNPINVVIKNPGVRTLACIEEAIPYMTGGPCLEITKIVGDKVRVRAAGYYNSMPEY